MIQPISNIIETVESRSSQKKNPSQYPGFQIDEITISKENNRKHITVMVKKASSAAFGINQTLISSKKSV